MNFFDRQDKVRTRSRVFFTAFVPAVILAVAALYFAVTFCLVVVFNFTQFVVESFEDRPKRSSSSYYDRYSRSDRAGREYGLNLLPADLYGSPANILAPRPIVIVGGGVVCFILLVAMCKHYAIRKGGGAYVLKLLGGRELRDPDSPAEKRLVNIVAEMALASGLPRPRVFVLDRESSINAVTAGLDHQDAVIAVTGGALAHLTREELQGVVAHEFAHILNDDYQLNLIMSGWLYGLLFFTIIGRGLIAVAESNEFLWEFNLTGLIGLVLVANGVLLRTAGSLGHMSAAIIEAAFCRTREHLADAFAVQFTRDPRGLTNALRKIGGQPGRVGFRNGQALTMKSFFIVDPASRRRGGFLSSHPSLASRIRALDPHWDRTFIPVDPQAIP
jgi:Zn-dependent protease with chaperone function